MPAKRIDRRNFLSGLTGAVALAFVPATAWAKAKTGKRLDFINTHTAETLSALYWQDGAYDRGALRDIDYILRDFRTGDTHTIDIKLLDLLTDLHNTSGSRRAFEVISGYRSPKTNAQLAAATDGIAKHSLHIQGQAIDIRLTDIALADLRDQAKGLARGGVGFYPKSDFVHIDTGPIRYW